MSNYFRRRYKRFDGDISAKVDLSDYATKTDLKNISHVDVSSFALKSNLATIIFHNILRLLDVLPNFPFTTSETMGDYYL